MAAVSAEGSTVWVLIRRLNSSCSRSMALVVRALFHWLMGNRVKVRAGHRPAGGCRRPLLHPTRIGPGKVGAGNQRVGLLVSGCCVGEPTTRVNANLVDVSYCFIVGQGEGEAASEFRETHTMRYFLPGIGPGAGDDGFKMAALREWMSDHKPDRATWNAAVVAFDLSEFFEPDNIPPLAAFARNCPAGAAARWCRRAA
jgi:hypothetical protein